MSKKIPLILIVGILGLLSASAMWFMNNSSSVSPMFGGVMMNDTGFQAGRETGSDAGMMAQGILPGEMDIYNSKIAPMPPIYYPSPGDALSVQDRSIQKYASHSVVVDNVDAYMRSTKDYLQSVGGIVLSYNQGTAQNDYAYGNIVAKVPLTNFDEVINHVTENVKKVVSASVDEQDVTGQVVQVDTKLQNLEDQKAKQEIALEEATTAADKKKVQLEIDRLDKQIVQVKQSQQVVEDRVDYASMTIAASNREYYFNGNGPRPVSDVIREAWYSLRGTGFGLLYFLIWVVVYAIIWIPVLLLARWIWGKVRPAAPKTSR